MPRGDGTGPWGLGRLTGRGAGFCAGYKIPGYLNQPLWGRNNIYRRGYGRGYGRLFCAASLLSGCAYLAYKLKNKNK